MTAAAQGKGKRKRGKSGKDKSVAYGWVGRWWNGTIGWILPTHLDPSGGNYPDFENQKYVRAARFRENNELIFCKITVEVIKRNGKPVRRRIRTKKEAEDNRPNDP